MNILNKEKNNLEILFICNSLDLGGAEKIMYEVVKNFKSYKIEIICLTQRGYYSKLIENEEIKVSYCNLKKNVFDIFKIIKLYKIILIKKPKIIHSFLYHSDLFASILGKLAFTKIIIWSVHHDCISSDNTILRNIQVKFLSIISNFIPNKIIYCSKESLRNHEKYGYSKRKSILIENGICLNKFKPRIKNYHKIRKLLNIKRSTFLIGHIARYHPIKGHKILLSSLKLVKEKNKNFKCIMIGKNVDKKNISLNNQIKENNLEEWIILYGETKYSQKLMNSFDLNIISSISESSSLVVMETMASGIPNLATNVGPLKKTIGATGWIAKKESTKDLAEKINFIIKNKSQIKEKSFLARKRIMSKYSQKRMLKAYKLIYKLYL